MYQQQVQFVINILMLVDALIVIGVVYAASYANWIVNHYDWRLDNLDAGYVALFLVFVNNFILGQMGLYSDRRPPQFLATVRSVILSVVILFVVFSGMLFFLKVDLSRLFTVVCASAIAIGFIVERAFLEVYLSGQQRTGFNCHRILLVGSPERIKELNTALGMQNSWGHKVIGYLLEPGYLPTAEIETLHLGGVDDLNAILLSTSVDEVIFAFSQECVSVNLKANIDLCEEVGTTYRIVPALYDPNDKLNIRVETIQSIPTLVKRAVRINAAGALYKRMLDYSVGMVGLLFFMFLYPVIGLLIKMDSSGPVLFKQPRVGEHGRVFNIYKFRTMVTGAESKLGTLIGQNEMKGHMFKMESDPRVTKIGRFLRKTSLDEFAQFINVMRGEMSLVGTRPPTVDEVAHYESRHRRRISIKPGITGLWQISGRNKIEDFEQVLKLDLQYIDNWQIMDDLLIIWNTVWVVLSRKGAR
ncbi:MAG TPA: sugar transferase [Humidesulfovibrio sp.]|uniref:sugar transferase n=1 Tax=Humidesulfovibrio sp. TaxID=2910988 RepID=UPI002B55CB9C|nr:sugar transferase [Humidesulfovibrio sp.]HWR04298.1 sugar transferase [Humidesulfovibrio sp.]